MSRLAPLRSVMLLSFVGAMSLACTRVKVEDVRGPGGGEWKAISCSRMNEKCFKTAERICPNGYVFARAEERSAKTVARTPAPSSEPAKVITLPPQDEWRGDMYEKTPGKLLVRCASSEPKLHASRD